MDVSKKTEYYRRIINKHLNQTENLEIEDFTEKRKKVKNHN